MLASVIRQLLAKRNRRTPASAIAERGGKRLEAGIPYEAKAIVGDPLAADPGSHAAHRLRGRIAFEQKRYGEARVAYQAALALQPRDAETLLEAGRVMYELLAFEDALALVERAVAAAPQDAHAHYCRGLMLRELGRYAEAETAMREAQRADVESLEALCGLALVLVDRHRHDEAESALRRVLGTEPQHPVARWQLAVLLLLQGRFAEGWRHYAARWLLYDTIRPRKLPFWDGKGEPDGPLLLLAEQALGDEILFASCFNDVIAQAGEVIIECDARLAALYARSFPQAVIWGTRNAPTQDGSGGPAPAMQIAAGSLPALYRPDAASFPGTRGYLRADEEKRERWRKRLAASGPGPKVGLSWRGGTAHTRAALRSVAPAHLAPLLQRTDIAFVSLQYGAVEQDLGIMEAATSRIIHHWRDALADYDETAALVSALDLVITVQTAAAHLAGALGQPVWILLPASPEWRYMAAGSRLPWYPSAELFRQREVGAWDEVIASVSAALDKRYPQRPSEVGGSS